MNRISETILKLAKRGLQVEFRAHIPTSIIYVAVVEFDESKCPVLCQSASVTFECAEDATQHVIETALVSVSEKVRQAKGWEEL